MWWTIGLVVGAVVATILYYRIGAERRPSSKIDMPPPTEGNKVRKPVPIPPPPPPFKAKVKPESSCCSAKAKVSQETVIPWDDENSFLLHTDHPFGSATRNTIRANSDAAGCCDGDAQHDHSSHSGSTCCGGGV